jgi:hypothetical protein
MLIDCAPWGTCLAAQGFCTVSHCSTWSAPRPQPPAPDQHGFCQTSRGQPYEQCTRNHSISELPGKLCLGHLVTSHGVHEGTVTSVLLPGLLAWQLFLLGSPDTADLWDVTYLPAFYYADARE